MTTSPAPRRRTSASTGAVVVGGAVVALSLACLVAALLGRPPGQAGEVARGVVAGLAYGGLGGLVAHRRPRLVLGWLMLLVGVSSAVSLACDLWARHALTVEGSSLPAGELAYWLSSWTWTPGYLLPLTLLLLLFPTGAPPSPRWFPVVWASAATVVVATVGWALTPYEDQDFAPPTELGPLENPLPVAGADVLLALALPVFLGCAVLSVASLVARWRRADPVGRDQLRWILLAAVVALVLVVVTLALPTHQPGLLAVAMATLPAATAVAILRRGLWQLDVVLSRSLIYGLLTLALLALYAVLVALAGAIVGDVGEDLRITAVAVAALAVQPLRHRLQAAVNRLMFGDRDDPAAAVARLVDRLDAVNHPTDVLPAVTETVARTLRLPWATIARPGHPVVAHGSPSGDLVEVPLVHRGRELGTLAVGTRRGEDGLGRREQALLERLAREAAVAAHAVALQTDLQASRERLVTSREEERRRVRRDLHDDLGPVLAATAMKLEATREVLEDDPVAASRSLDRAASTLRDAVASVRRIVDDLRPASLDGLGLVGALQEQLDQFTDAGVRLDLEVQDPSGRLGDLPAAVDVAAYRIASEAVTNALRHARPTGVRVTLAVNDRDLVVTVADDGAGLRGGARAGVGLESMHARAAELGGTCALESTPGGGTLVTARLPMEAM